MDLEQDIDVLNNRLNDSEMVRAQLANEINGQADQLRTQKELIEAQHKQIAALEHSAEMQRKRIFEQEHEGQNMKNDIGRLVDQKNKLHKDLEGATDHIISMEEKVFKSNKISLEVLK